METWAWLLAYVVGFGLLQLVLYHHFRRKDATPESAVNTADGGGNQSIEAASTEKATDQGFQCQHCGAHNAHFSTVRYCRECVNPLR